MAVKVVAFLLAVLLPTVSGGWYAQAHPHVWIQHSLELVAEDGAIKEIQLSWVFDPMFSSVLIGDYDKDRNGSFSPQEMKALQKEAFLNLREFDYFTYLRLDGRQVKPQDAENFSAEMTDKLVRYRFSIPLLSGPKTVEVSLFDETYFVALQPDREKPFSIRVARGATPTCAGGEGKTVQGSISSFSPNALICSFPAAQ